MTKKIYSHTLNNSDPLITHKREDNTFRTSPVKLLRFGLDRVVFALYPTSLADYDTLLQQIPTGVAYFSSSKVFHVPLLGTDFELLSPNSPGGNRPYPIRIKCENYQLEMASRNGSRKFHSKDIPVILFSPTARTTYFEGPDSILKSLEEVFRVIPVSKYHLSKAELAADFVGLDLKYDDISKFKCRATVRSMGTPNELETIYFGRSKAEIVCCIYDKTRESKKNNKEWYVESLSLPESHKLTRIEFRFNRKFLRKNNLHTLQQFSLLVPAIWRHCVSKFIVHLEEGKPSPMWVDIQNIITEGVESFHRQRKIHKRCGVEVILSQIKDSMTELGAELDVESPTGLSLVVQKYLGSSQEFSRAVRLRKIQRGAL